MSEWTFWHNPRCSKSRRALELLRERSMTTAELRERDRRVFRAARARDLRVVWNLAGGYQTPLRKVLDIHGNTAREHIATWADSQPPPSRSGS